MAVNMRAICKFLGLITTAVTAARHRPASITTETCSSSACVDYIGTCGSLYGGCFPICSGYATPTFTDPGCQSTSSEAQATTTCMMSACIYYVNDCGLAYGGCFPDCPGYLPPKFTAPPCPSTTDIITPTATMTKTDDRRKPQLQVVQTMEGMVLEALQSR